MTAQELFSDRLFARTDSVNSPLAVGLDPTPDCLPADLVPSAGSRRDWANAYRTFGKTVLETCREHTAVVKIQIAFFEVLGGGGFDLFFELTAPRFQVPNPQPVTDDGQPYQADYDGPSEGPGLPEGRRYGQRNGRAFFIPNAIII